MFIQLPFHTLIVYHLFTNMTWFYRKVCYLLYICLLNNLSTLRQLMMEAWRLPKRDFLETDRFQSASCQPSKMFNR